MSETVVQGIHFACKLVLNPNLMVQIEAFKSNSLKSSGLVTDLENFKKGSKSAHNADVRGVLQGLQK
jgi:hypothetical protein